MRSNYLQNTIYRKYGITNLVLQKMLRYDVAFFCLQIWAINTLNSEKLKVWGIDALNFVKIKVWGIIDKKEDDL